MAFRDCALTYREEAQASPVPNYPAAKSCNMARLACVHSLRPHRENKYIEHQEESRYYSKQRLYNY